MVNIADQLDLRNLTQIRALPDLFVCSLVVHHSIRADWKGRNLQGWRAIHGEARHDEQEP